MRKTIWPSGLRRWLKAPFRKGVDSNPIAVITLYLQPDAGRTFVVYSEMLDAGARNRVAARFRHLAHICVDQRTDTRSKKKTVVPSGVD